MIGRQRAQRRLPAHWRRSRRRSRPSRWRSSRRNIAGRAARARIRVAARREQAVDRVGDAGIAVAHRPVDDHRVAEALLQRLGLARGDRSERRALLGPDLRISVGAFLGRVRRMIAVEDRLPQPAAGFRPRGGRTGIRQGSAAPRAASGASGVPRLVSSTPTRGAGIAGWSLMPGSSGRTAGGASAFRSRRRSHWRPPAASTSAPSPLTPPGGLAAGDELDLDLGQSLSVARLRRAEWPRARHAGDDFGRRRRSRWQARGAGRLRSAGGPARD